MLENKKKTTTWRDRVRALDHVPGIEMPDKVLGWEKLNKRLRSPRGRIDRWLAAAGFLGAIVLPSLKDEEDEPGNDS